jgi:hypothetical protein
MDQFTSLDLGIKSKRVPWHSNKHSLIKAFREGFPSIAMELEEV